MPSLQNTHPRDRAKGGRQCRVCSARIGLIRKYHLNICRRCFRERAPLIGFKKVMEGVPVRCSGWGCRRLPCLFECIDARASFREE